MEIGFQLAGHWHLDNGEIHLQLIQHGTRRNILYAFVSDGVVKYVGKTVQPLQRRLQGYRKPGTTQTTNIRNNALIKELLCRGESVDVLALPDNGLLHYGQFHVNLAAGLEDSIILELQPEWNGVRSSLVPESQVSNEEVVQSDVVEPSEIVAFAVVLHRTYFNRGFFNVPLAHADLFGGDGQSIEIFCRDAELPLRGYINRSANLNRTPRIMGGVPLRDWFQSICSEGRRVTISVYSPTSIRIDKCDE